MKINKLFKPWKNYLFLIKKDTKFPIEHNVKSVRYYKDNQIVIIKAKKDEYFEHLSSLYQSNGIIEFVCEI